MNFIRNLIKSILARAKGFLKLINKVKEPWVKQLLKAEEIREVLRSARGGDVLLVRTIGEGTTELLGSGYTHAAYCIEKECIVDATGKGVKERDMLSVLIHSSWVVVLRPKLSASEIRRASNEARTLASSNIEYDYAFSTDNEDLYCSEAVMVILNKGKRDFVKPKEVLGIAVLTPTDLRELEGKFELVLEFQHN